MTWLALGLAFQWPGYLLGLTGVLMTTSKVQRVRQVGFTAAAFSNLAWGCYAVATGGVALMLMQVTYLVICCIGVYKNRKS